MALAENAPSGSPSQPSTSVRAAAWTITSGRRPTTASRTAPRTSIGSRCRSAAITSTRPKELAATRPGGTPPGATSPPSTSWRSRPSRPPAPVRRTLTRSSRADRRGRPIQVAPALLAHRGRRDERLPPAPVVGIPTGGLGDPLRQGDRRLPAELAPDLGGVEQVAAIVRWALRNDALQRCGLAERAEH